MRRQNEAIQRFRRLAVSQLRTLTPRCHRPQRLLSAATGSRGPAPNSNARRSRNAEVNDSKEQEWAVRLTDNAALPLNWQHHHP